MENSHQHQFLRAFHAIIIGWNELAAFIGEILSIIPLIPELSSDEINIAIFFICFSMPAIYILIRIFITEHYDPLSYNSIQKFINNNIIFMNKNRLLTGKNRHILRGKVFNIKMLSAIFYLVIIIATYILIPVAFYLGISLMKHPLYEYVMTISSYENYAPIAIIVVFLLMVAYTFIAMILFSIANVRGYGKGMFVVLTFIITIEMLYALNTPGLSDWIDAKTENVLGPVEAPQTQSGSQ